MSLLHGTSGVGTHCQWYAMAVVGSWFFAWHKVLGVSSGVSSLASAMLVCLSHHTASFIGAGVKRDFCIFK